MNLPRVACFAVGLCGLVAGCGHLNFSRGETAPEKPPSCIGEAKDLGQKKLGVDGALEDRLKAAWGGVLELEATTKKLEEKLITTCDNLTRELGGKPGDASAAPVEADEGAKEAVATAESPAAKSTTAESSEGEGPDSSGETATGPSATANVSSVESPAEASCQTALKQLTLFKEQTGTSLTVDVKPFSCAARTDDFASCARKCDPNLPPGNLEIACDEGKQRGRCSGKCSGQCAQINTTECAATCAGECKGGCNKGFYGKCGGKCIGTCDMGNVNGKCDGICDGKCLSDAAGTCEGKCTGKCVGACLEDMKAKMCDGTCRGDCDAPMSAAVCGQIYPPAEMSQECVAMCSAALTSKFQCSVDHVGITLVKATKESDGLKLRNALAGRLKEILEVGDGMKVPFDEAAVRVTESLEALNGELENNTEASKSVGTCMSEAAERKNAASATFGKFAEISAAILQAARN
jgi:hypothetical protein